MAALTQSSSDNPLAPRSRRLGEKAILAVLFACGAVSIVTTVAIVLVLLNETIPFFRDVSWQQFVFDTEWQPFGDDLDTVRLGIWPLITGTMHVTVIGLLISVPIGLAAATYLSEYADPRVRNTLKPTLELLAGIPTVVLGFFALTTVTPFFRNVLGLAESMDFFNSFSGGLVVGVMLIPTVASVSEDSMSAVPNALREAGYGLGASKSKVALRVVFPAALSGIVAAIILAMSRAVGETMIVALAVGSRPQITLNPFEQNQTMTGYIAQSVGGEAARGSFQYEALFAVGSTLFVITLALNLIAAAVVRRYRQEY